MQLVKYIGQALYTITGLRAFASYLDSKVTNYRLRLNIVPVTYKLFVWSIGLATGASATFLATEYQETTTAWTFENPAIVAPVRAEANAIAIEEEPEWKVAEFSAYTASADETDSSPLIMASGKMVYLGAIACPRSMKLGTVIELKNGEQYTCEDRMHARYQNHFDIFMTTKQEAKNFGRKQLEYKAI